MAHKKTDAGARPDAAPREEGLRLRTWLRYLYHGSRPLAVKFRLAVIMVDVAIIAFFLA